MTDDATAALKEAQRHFSDLADDSEWHIPGSTASIRDPNEGNSGHKKLSHSPAGANLDVADFLQLASMDALTLDVRIRQLLDGRPSHPVDPMDCADCGATPPRPCAALGDLRARSAAFTRLADADRRLHAAFTAAQEAGERLAELVACDQPDGDAVRLARYLLSRRTTRLTAARLRRDQLAESYVRDATEEAFALMRESLPILPPAELREASALADRVTTTVRRMTRETRLVVAVGDCPYCEAHSIILDPRDADLAKCANRKCLDPAGSRRQWSDRAGEWAIFGWDRSILDNLPRTGS